LRIGANQHAFYFETKKRQKNEELLSHLALMSGTQKEEMETNKNTQQQTTLLSIDSAVS
jgi:hypothetical protein